MAKIYIPSTGVDQWQRLLADPEKHWRKGYSARTLAYCWEEEANDFPSSVRAVLDNSGIESLQNLELLLAVPEHPVPLRGGARPSQNDVWALARGQNGLVSIAVEGKVSEPFGPTLEEWLQDASPGKKDRLNHICEQLGLNVWPPSPIRYQLLHRAASAVIEAQRFCASHAVMLVHSFSPQGEWFEDYKDFLDVFGCTAFPKTVSSAGTRAGVRLYFGWVQGEDRFRDM